MDGCDGVDEDCDGNFDEDSARGVFFEDRDGDGVGDDVPVLACVAPPGFVALGGDCDDANPMTGAPQPRWVDGDGDGVGSGEPVMVACGDAPGGLAPVGGDCNDAAPSVGDCDAIPGATGNCTAGACVIVRCDGTRVDCDGVIANGCEIDPESDPDRCGGCAAPACGIGAPCMGGSCDETLGGIAASLGTCVVRAGGEVVCWGNALIPPPTGNVPSIVASIDDAVAIWGGAGAIMCATRSVGGVSCWGINNSSGVSGHGSAVSMFVPPTPILVSDAVAASVGTSSGCAIRPMGNISCWGRGTSGELGNGTRISSLTPVSVIGIGPALQVELFDTHACALLDDGTVRCWGSGSLGQLGDGGTTL